MCAEKKQITLQSPITALPGFGVKRAQLLSKLGLSDVGDFLTYFPRDYEDRSVITTLSRGVDGIKACFRLVIGGDATSARLPRGGDIVKVRAFDNTGSVEIVFFNRPYIKNQLIKGKEYIFYGKLEGNGTRFSMINPLFELDDGREGGVTGRIVPIYPLSQGVTSAMIASGVRAALELNDFPESPLPPELEHELGFMPRDEAFRQIHFPDDITNAQNASRRFAFEELYVFCCSSVGLKLRSKPLVKKRLACHAPTEFYEKLPFAPTNAQKRSINELFADMSGQTRMNRLLQGDVGSGKTLVAAAGAWLCHKNNAQAVIMAPTEILARQHQKTLTSLLAPFGMSIGLLVSSMPAAEKRQALELAKDGTFNVICGTHALIQQGVEFKNPALFVVDEQHRFGVAQRAALSAKRPDSHTLVMSATPIPRTLSLIIFGDLDLSILDETPSGRLPIETYSIGNDKRARMYAFLQKQIAEGGQGYIICPLIEDGEGNERAAAETYAEALSAALPNLRVGLMHGRLSAKQKDEVMTAFGRHQIDVLVSTTVIEVGIDVPNANIMIIENSEAFGLSQIHQLRGRVGRGRRQSYCILMRTGRRTPRIEVVCNTSDGFKIAEEDLRLRGPGDFFGQRQHGLPSFKLADLSSDLTLFERARTCAEQTFRADPTLSLPQNRALRARVQSMLEDDRVKLN